jgi:pimeloyl-ACP methyl ester carboxylesterase
MTEEKPDMTTPTSTPTSPNAASRTVTIATGMDIVIAEFGANTEGAAVLYLHGGAGPRTMTGLAAALSEHVYGIVPTHPGFDGTFRPERFDTMADLADAYLDLLDELDLSGVMVIGNSIGGWIAAEMALRDNRGRIGSLVVINAVGIKAVGAEQVTDTRQLTGPQMSQLSFTNAAFRPDFASFTDEQRAATAANQQTLAVYAGEAFTHDPKLRRRLHRITIPALVLWGEQDGISPIGYGRDYAAALGNGQFAPIADAGHFPQIEQLGATLDAISNFVDTVVKPDQA